ncbi:MAG: CBS domain-containing protein [Archangiaceae bacterium]|nr:CBS domain-containing protein [Archangiaceae bacterium]
MAVCALDLMSPIVFQVNPDTRVSLAWTSMRDHDVRHVCVTDSDGRLVGLASDRDILVLGEGRAAGATALREVMTREPITSTADVEAPDLAELMLTEHLEAVPIIDAERRPIGIVTSSDVLRALARAT